MELLIYDCCIGHCNELLEYLQYICVNIHSPWQQYYPANFLPVVGLWVWLGGVQPSKSKLDTGVELLIYDCGISHCNELLEYLRYICVNIHCP